MSPDTASASIVLSSPTAIGRTTGTSAHFFSRVSGASCGDREGAGFFFGREGKGSWVFARFMILRPRTELDAAGDEGS